MIPRLDDWLSGALSGEEALAFEDELFAAAARGELPVDAAFLDRMLMAASLLARGGTYEPGLVRDDLPRLRALGRRVEVVDVVADLAIPQDAEIVVLRVALPATDAPAVDVVTVLDGAEVAAVRDLPVAPGSNEVLFCCEGDRVRAGAGMAVVMRIVVRDGVDARILCEVPVTAR